MSVLMTGNDFLKSAPGAEPVQVEGLFRTDPDRVFKAFTVPEDIECWFAPEGSLATVEIDLKVGGKWRFVYQRNGDQQERLEGEYLEIEAPNRLKFSWRHVVEHDNGSRQETDFSFVSISFKSAGSATEVKLRHEAIKTEDARLGVGAGWQTCLHRMADFLAKPFNEEMCVMEPTFVDQATWLDARKALLAKEKAFTRERDELSKARRSLPMLEIKDTYVFETANGGKTLSELFGPHPQLLIYHFMFGETWEEGCPSCSFWADNFDGLDVHLSARGTALAATSNAPLQKLLDYQKRLGWSFTWASTAGNSFSQDFRVTFPGKEVTNGNGYNYTSNTLAEELPGVSAFLKLPDGRIGHTYSTYGRGLDILNMAYNLLDLTPIGRQEDNLPFPMAWVRRRDQYESV